MEESKSVVKAKVVFVSWNSAQKDVKNQICGYLNKHLASKNGGSISFEDREAVAEKAHTSVKNFDAVFDSDKDCFGDITEACKNGVMLSTVFLVICTDSAVNSKWVMYEIDCAQNSLSRNYIVPVYLTELLSDESNKAVQSLASGVTVERLAEIVVDERSVLGLSESDLRTVLNKVQVAINEHVYNDYLLSQIKNLDSTVIKDYEGGNSDRFDFKSLYVSRNIYKVESGGVNAETNFTERMLVDESDSAPVLIYGKSGSGKSMLINKIVYDIYENLANNAGGGKAVPLVFKVPLKELKGGDLTGYLFEKFTSAGRYGNYTVENFKDLLSLRNRDGGIRIFFDAVDEVISLGERQSAIENINAFCTRYNNCKLVFTARSADRDFVLNAAKSLNADCKTFCLEQFSGAQSKRYIENIFSQLKQNGRLKEQSSPEQFTAAIADINGQIKSNPFILTQLIFIYNDGGAEKLPKTLAPIYEKAMRFYIRREKDATLNEDLNEYEKILSQAAYFKFADSDKNFRELFAEIGEYEPSADKAYNFFTARSVINNDAFFYQIFNDYYAAKYIFTNSFGLNRRMRYEIRGDELISGLKEDLASGGKWNDVCRIFLSMVEAKCGEDVFARVIALLGDENCRGLLLEIAADALTKYRLTAEYALINDVLLRTANGGFGWYNQLCYYVPAYNLYAPFALCVADFDGEGKRKALCVLRDICFIYGAFDGVEQIPDISERAAERLKSQCREIYAEDIAAFKAGKPFDQRAALNITFYLGLSFADETARENPRFKGDVCPKSVTFGGESYPVENITANFAATYPREFCVLHALNRRSRAEVDRPWKKLFSDSENLFKQCGFDESFYTGLRFAPLDKAKISGEFTAEKASRLTGLVLLPTDETVLEYIGFCKENLYYYSFPDNITALGYFCFNFCRKISYMFIGGNVTKINKYCFNSINSLYFYLEYGERWQSIKKEDNLKAALCKIKCSGLKVIGEFAFKYCNKLALKRLPESVEKIGRGAFKECTTLALEKLPESLGHIGYNAFENCVSLALKYLPEKLYEICWGAFENCVSLSLEKLPEGLQVLEGAAFRGCSSLALTHLPDEIDIIDYCAFSGCTSLALTRLPAALIEIEERAFENCNSLRLNSLPRDLVFVGQSSFKGCPPATLQAVEDWRQIVKKRGSKSASLELPPVEKFGGTDFFKSIKEKGYKKYDISEVIFSDSTKSIDIGAFSCCSSIASVRLPESLTEIGYFAFLKCTSLELTRLPESVEVIQDSAFYGCTLLALTKLPEGMTELSESVFKNCASLALTSLPRGVTKIEKGAFDGCKSLALTALPEGLTKISEYSFYGCESLALEKLPEGITIIEWGAFKGCTALALESLPDGVEKIDKSAFKGCSSLALTKLPERLKGIGEGAFENCGSLALTKLPEGLTEIGEAAFKNCGSLALTKLPEGLTEIEDSVFEGCRGIKLDGLPRGLEIIERNAFKNCASLGITILNEGLLYIGGGAFSGCAGIEEIAIPLSVMEIGDNAFAGCPLKKVTLPKKFGHDISRVFGDIDKDIITFI